ncbi:serine-rich adhesin for platelets [Chironomus tepperi]|uniref:serine-rich adhesin for platelets n=1 Tax=Chironomus tepperi TaxID=113505 RepID=UPI00391F62DD
MDTIYSNKKYLQNLSAADYYRTGTMRPTTNEYASYHNTMSRRSLFGSHYSHQPNISKYKYSYPSDVSLSSHYGYTSWGLWRDTGHLSPSVYSKKRINIRSFSILIMSAAFIVLLAVLSVAGLAFYFSTFKSDSTESMLVFDCSFRIAKGDIWVSQLKYNQTPIFRQKAAFYTKFIETSLEHGNFNVAKTDINSFGNGPDIQLSFRIYLDMRKIQMTITNVEEHIKNAFISETGISDSTHRNMKIDIDTIEIKRQLDPEILQKAAFIYEQQSQDILTTLMPTTVIPLDDLQMSTRKVNGTTAEKSKLKTSTQTPHATRGGSKPKMTPKPLQESDIDTENLPVIQGSFEITKTDADISQKRANARPASTASLTPNTLKPFYISPASSIKVKSSGHSTSSSTTTQTTKKIITTTTTMASTTAKAENIVEMFLQHQKNLQKQQKVKESPVTAKIEKTNKSGETIKSAAGEIVTESIMATSTTLQMTTNAPHEYVGSSDIESQINNKDLPKLDVSLFTSAPILDNEPWRPINPSPEQVKTQHLPTAAHTSESTLSSSSSSLSSLSTEMPPYRSPFNPKPIENVIYRNKFVDPDATYPVKDSGESISYQSFYNPDFSAGSLEIEKLGIADVKPYPLPINKIDISEEVSNPEQSSQMEMLNDNKKLMIDTSNVNYDENKFEHLGGGVIAKKHDNSSSSSSTNVTTTTISSDEVVQSNMNATNDAAVQSVVEMTKNDTDTDTSLDDIFQELLDNNNVTLNKTQDDVLESRIVSDDEDGENDDDTNENAYDEVATSDGGAEDEKILTTTSKLNFLNMKNFIMQMKQNSSHSLVDISDETTTYKTPLSTLTFELATATTTFNDVSGFTTIKPTTTFVEVDTVKYTPMPFVKSTTSSNSASIISEPQLFPSISKWEFVNGTRTNNSSEMSLTKKVFNETLQAVIVENSQTASHVTHLDDLKANQTVDKGNLQQLSSIFDTLAAKLGIKPDVASKVPPFSQYTQNKIKQNANNNNQLRTTAIPSTRKNLGSTTRQYVTRATTKTSKKSPTPMSSTTSRAVTKVSSDPTRGYELSSETVMGQAEVEAVDPTQYEEILSLASSPITRKFISTTPSLVTLMPVKSNSGIRNFNPRFKIASNSQTSSETRNLETVVKASMSFDS